MKSRHDDDGLTSAEWAEIDAACDGFESAWRAGPRPVIADYAVTLIGAPKAKLLQELILLDVEYRRVHGENVSRSDYELQFPAEQEVLDQVFDNSLAQTLFSSDQDTPDELETVLVEMKSLDRPDESGRVVGSYRIIQLLGKGGMGTVYRAAHTMIDCERAIKFLKPSLANDSQAVKRFLQEAQTTLVHLSHPNIVKTYDLSREGDQIFLVMEVLTGEDLSSLVRRRGRLAPDEAVRIIEQAATGLAYAHGLGFVHRDIKPQNLMLTAEGVVKILDLGLVRALEAADAEVSPRDRTKSGETLVLEQTNERLTDGVALLGTLAYMSPEQAKNPRLADARSDLYSLGVTLYFLLTGEHAFRGKTPSEVLQNVLNNRFVPLRKIRPEIPPSLERILQQLMSMRPADRFSSGKHLAKVLRSWRLQERLDHSPQEFTEPVTFETDEDLKVLLNKLNIVSESDWFAADRISGRSRMDWAVTTLALPNGAQGPERILDSLETIYTSSEEKQGISSWQKQSIARGNADLLRLPHHVLIDRIGVGWKGEVFKARNLQTGTFEVIRTFSAGSLNGLKGDDSERLRQFMEEIPKIAAVTGSIFPAILGFQTCKNRIHKQIAYVTTEYVKGRSGREIVLSSQLALSERTEWALRAILKLARGLQVAHDAGVFHLDIHGRSVQFDAAGGVWLLDLGIANLVARHCAVSQSDSLMPELATLAPTTTGTPYVMPPEQWLKSEGLSSAVDIYNLGCTLCYFLTGEYQFKWENVAQLQHSILFQKPEESEVVKRIAEPIRSTLVKMLAKDPHQRPSAAAVADEIDHLLKTSAHKPVSLSTKTNSWFQRIFGTRQ